jgi:hypothetical protein
MAKEQMSVVRILILGAVFFLGACGDDSVVTSGTIVKVCSNGLKIVRWKRRLYVLTLTSHREVPNASVDRVCEAIGSTPKT